MYGPRPAQSLGLGGSREAGLDPAPVPERAVLVGQKHDLAAAPPGVAARVVQQHQGEEAVNLGLVGHELRQRDPEPDRLPGQVGAPVVALVEDQIDDREDARQPVRQQMVGGHAERNPRLLDLPLGPNEPLGHRRLGHEEGPRDLVGLKPAERPERERNLRIQVQRRMRAGEDQLEALVGEARVGDLVLHRLGHLQELRPGRQRSLAAEPVDRPVSSGHDEPARRIVRHAVPRPALDGDGKRLLDGFLGAIEVTEEADHRGKDPPPLPAEDLLDQLSTSGRISTAPP